MNLQSFGAYVRPKATAKGTITILKITSREITENDTRNCLNNE